MNNNYFFTLETNKPMYFYIGLAHKTLMSIRCEVVNYSWVSMHMTAHTRMTRKHIETCTGLVSLYDIEFCKY